MLSGELLYDIIYKGKDIIGLIAFGYCLFLNYKMNTSYMNKTDLILHYVDDKKLEKALDDIEKTIGLNMAAIGATLTGIQTRLDDWINIQKS